MKANPIVHIVDDDDAVRDGLALLLKSENIACETYSSAEDFLESDLQHQRGCLLLDVRMPGMNGLQLMKFLKEKSISIPVIFITGHGDITMAVEAMKMGAIDFVEKPFDNDLIIKIIRKCLELCVSMMQLMETKEEISLRISRLTKREKQVMELLVQGLQNKKVASELGISPRTVELHRAKIMEKLQAHSLSEVVRFALIFDDPA